ncbi:MAG TPA: redox-regulated ATPase YchF [Alphaproteobacteria bacterium]|nr:redox-regulated ATPase YchF [Alphaproteobacteria bacterium]
MGFDLGIVGLPNVGKSTLFNALTETAAAEAANYPFCTIEPNIGRVAVPDRRLDAIARIARSAKTVPNQLGFVDIAGLVRGASKGEGLGNQFLGHIREVDAIAHLVRCFDGEVAHHNGKVDPLRDIETIETELMLADLDSLERRLLPLQKRAKGGDREAQQAITVIEPALAALRAGRPARDVVVPPEQGQAWKQLQLLTQKPVLYVANVEEASAATGNRYSTLVVEHAKAEGAQAVIISAAIEAEVALLDPDDRRAFLAHLGLEETGLARVIRAGFKLLDLITFFTAGPKEAHAWTVRKGAKAPEAAGVIHTDFERGFISVETIAFEDFVAYGGEQGAKEAGRMRLEGRDYIVQDGDVLRVRFNV